MIFKEKSQNDFDIFKRWIIGLPKNELSGILIKEERIVDIKEAMNIWDLREDQCLHRTA